MSTRSITKPRATRLAICIAFALAPWAASNAAETPEDVRLDPVDVHSESAAAIKVEQSLTPGAVSVVDGETFYARPVNHMGDSLRYVPGVWTESTLGGDAVFVSSRGSNLDATDYDTNGIKLLQDGLPVTTADGNNHNRFLDPMAARYAVIARGANGLGYGASTLGGAIDFLTPTARDGAATQIFLNGGSDGQYNGRLSAGGISGDFDGLITLDAKERDGYRTHSRQERSGLYANAGWQIADSIGLRLFATHIDSDEELAGTLTRAQFEADPTQASSSAISGNFQLNVRSDRLAGKAIWDVNANSRLEIGLSFEEQSLYHPIVDKILVDFDGEGPNPPVEVFSLLKNTEQRNVGGSVRYNLKTGQHDVLAGINLGDTREDGGNYRNNGGERNGLTGVIDNDAGSTEVFVLDRWNFAPDWTLVYGAQGVLAERNVRTTSVANGAVRNPREEYSSFNPRVGAIYAFGNDSEAFASVSRLFEAPTNFELEDDVRGNNATLDPMHGTVYEVGLRGATAASDNLNWHWDVSAYHAQIRDEILSVDDPAAPGTSLSTNVARTTHAGIEAVVGASLPIGDGAHRIEPLISATRNDFSFDNDAVYANNDLPAAPNYAVRGEVMYRHPSGFSVGPTFDLIGKRYADFSNSYRIDGYHLLGLRVAYAQDRWEAFGELRNLQDKAYIATLSVRDLAHPTDALLQPGAPRSTYFGVRMKF